MYFGLNVRMGPWLRSSKWSPVVPWWRPLIKRPASPRACGFLASSPSRRPPTDLLHVTPPVCLASPPLNPLLRPVLWANPGSDDKHTRRESGQSHNTDSKPHLDYLLQLEGNREAVEEDAQRTSAGASLCASWTTHQAGKESRDKLE